tara:strand:- start:268 stop:381 length:114 start_codon:yes stop_codon:yes gene_type:complete
MLVLNPEKRITISDLLNDIYFNDDADPPCEPWELPDL